MLQLTFEQWNAQYRPRYFECGDGYHECDHADTGDHGRWLYPIDLTDPEELSDRAAGDARLIWSWLPDGRIVSGIQTAADWLLETELPATEPTQVI